MEKAPTESYADVGGLEQQIQEIKEAVELPLTHPELYEDIGIKPPKVRWILRATAATQILRATHSHRPSCSDGNTLPLKVLPCIAAASKEGNARVCCPHCVLPGAMATHVTSRVCSPCVVWWFM